ncbi:MAG: hypothetical protein HY906_21695 [Deltaproteobacteria bacterium]|nr:hypothetical protein [Deltaproteobacteria bacterium]
MRKIAAGKATLSRQDLEGLIAELVVDSDRRSQGLSKRFEGLLEMLLSSVAAQKLDLKVAMDLLVQIGHLHRGEAEEVRRNLALLAHVHRVEPPLVRVVAAGPTQVNVAPPLRLGGRGRR